MTWFLIRCVGVRHDGTGAFPTNRSSYAQSYAVEELVARWKLRKADPGVGIPDLFYPETLTAAVMAERQVHGVNTFGYSFEPVDRPAEGAWICEDYLVCAPPF